MHVNDLRISISMWKENPSNVSMVIFVILCVSYSVLEGMLILLPPQ